MAGTLELTAGGALDARGVGDHWTDLALFTDSVRNMVARPGTFDTLFPETTDDGIVLLLMDGLAECHLHATFTESGSDANGLVRPVLTSGQVALVVLNAGIRMIRAELFNRVTSSKYVAGPVSAEITYATNILRDIMKALEDQRQDVTNRLTTSSGGLAFYMQDQYRVNNWAAFHRYDALGELAITPGWLACA